MQSFFAARLGATLWSAACRGSTSSTGPTCRWHSRQHLHGALRHQCPDFVLVPIRKGPGLGASQALKLQPPGLLTHCCAQNGRLTSVQNQNSGARKSKQPPSAWFTTEALCADSRNSALCSRNLPRASRILRCKISVSTKEVPRRMMLNKILCCARFRSLLFEPSLAVSAAPCANDIVE